MISEMNAFKLSFPITKVNEEERTVCGIATADNVDAQEDQVTFEASKEAFSKWLGNVREMHGPHAVGKAVSVEEIPVVSEGRYFNGIEVKSYISEGAPDTWLKVKEGILAAYSIGGKILDAHYVYNENDGTAIRVVTKYELGELSLVDNPGNPLARLTLVKTNDDGKLEEIMDSSPSIVYCGACKVATIAKDACPQCNGGVEVIGYTQDVSLPVITKMIKKFEQGVSKKEEEMTESQELLKSEKDDNLESNMDLSVEQEEGIFKRFKKWLLETEDASTSAQKESEDNEGGDIQKSEENGGSEVDFKEALDEAMAKFGEKLDEVKADLTKSIDEKIDVKLSAHTEEISKSVGDLTEKVDETTNSLTEVATKVGAIEEVAIKKSGDAESNSDDGQEIEKTSFWGGTFVPVSICKAIGYED